MKKSLVYIEGEFCDLDRENNLSDRITFENLHIQGDELDIYVDQNSLTTDFVSKLNQEQFNTGILYSIYFINDINRIKNDRVITESSKISVFLRKKNNIIEGNDRVQYFSRKDTTVDNVKSILSDTNSVLSCMLDGSNWRIHLSDGMILGKQRNALIESKYKYPHHVQKCINSTDENIIYGDEFDITHIFLNSCSDSLVDKTLYGSNLNVVQSLLKNSSSVISSYRMKNGNESENLLHTHLLMNGYNANEIHYILNVNASLQQNELSPYINFGNTINLSKPPLSINEISVSQVSKNIWGIDFYASKEVPYFECELYLPSEVIKSLLNQKSNLSMNVSDEDIYFTYIPNVRTNTVKCIWFSYKNFHLSSIQVYLTDYQESIAIEKYLLDTLENIQKFTTLGIGSNKLKNKVDDFSRSEISKLIQSLPYQRNKFMLEEFRKSEESLYKGIEPFIRQTMMIDYPIEHFHNKSIINSLAAENIQNCPNCDSRIFIKESIVPVLSSIRYSGICRVCHNPFDMTDLSKKSKLIKCSGKRRNDSYFLEIELKNINNYSNSSYFVFFVPTTDYSSNIDDIVINQLSNEEGYYVLEKGETLKFNVEFKRDRSQSEIEKFIDYNIYVIENGELQYYSRKIVFPSREMITGYEELKKDIVGYLEKFLPEKRVVHSLNVAKKAVELADFYGENIYEAEIAALLHDSAKGFDKDKEFEKYLNGRGILTDINGIKLPHASVGRDVAARIFNIDNAQILSAIFWHTTGRKDMLPLEKIIFVSDYISDERTFDNLTEIRNVAKLDLDLAVGKIMDYYIEYLCIVNDLNPKLAEIECRDFYLSGV